jgi:hypothetical protein
MATVVGYIRRELHRLEQVTNDDVLGKKVWIAPVHCSGAVLMAPFSWSAMAVWSAGRWAWWTRSCCSAS